MKAFQYLCFLTMLYGGLTCTRKKNPPNKGTVWQRLVGKDVTTNPYSSSGDHPVNTGDELACNFESGGCCWSNASPPTDQLDWVLVSGAPEPKKLQSSFGTQTAPSGTALGAGSESAASDGSSQQAQLYSCPIVCSDGPVSVNLKHWQSKDVTIQVCQETDPAGPLSNCQSLPSSSGNADTVTFSQPPANTRLVIVASGFTAKLGSVALIDDINVQFKQCFTTSTTSTTAVVTQAVVVPSATTVAPATCKALTCSFESGDTCSYSIGQNTGTKQWQTVKPPYQNPLTGIKAAAQGAYCAAAYLNPGDNAVMSTDVSFPAGYILTFYGYRATEGVDLLACCGDTGNCPFSTTKNVQVGDYRQWKSATVSCPAGTTKVLFKAQNSGTNYGAVGLDDIRVVTAGGNQAAC